MNPNPIILLNLIAAYLLLSDFLYLLPIIMILRNLLFFIAILLIIGWVLGFFVWQHEGFLIHTLLLLAIISLVFGLTRKKTNDIS